MYIGLIHAVFLKLQKMVQSGALPTQAVRTALGQKDRQADMLTGR
jgi:hypothetical protein